MKKLILLAFGIFVAGIAAYSVPHDYKGKPDIIKIEKIYKVFAYEDIVSRFHRLGRSHDESHGFFYSRITGQNFLILDRC